MNLEKLCNQVQNITKQVGAFITGEQAKFSLDKVEKPSKQRRILIN
jgi:hypothetical protein